MHIRVPWLWLFLATLLTLGRGGAMPAVKQPWYRSKVPQAAVPTLATAPVIDGKLNEDEWSGATSFAGLQSTRCPYVLPDVMQGRIWIACDAKQLYIGLRSAMPPPFKYAPEGLRSKGKKHDDSNKIEGGDHWEVRFYSEARHRPPATYLFYVNPDGVYSDQRITPEHKGGNRHVVGLEWESRAAVARGRALDQSGEEGPGHR